jgi:hypothetical protein
MKMNVKILMAASVIALSGAAFAGEMGTSTDAGGNPATKGAKTPSQPNETQPGMNGGNRSTTGTTVDQNTGSTGSSGEGRTMSGDTSTRNPNPGNPAEKGARTPSQPNETQPGTGSVKK